VKAGVDPKGGLPAVAPIPPNQNLKNTQIFRLIDSKCFIWFTLQLKSADDYSIGTLKDK
jgi:hypothetical protein